MKIILQENNKYVIRFDKGEEIIQGLIDFCEAPSPLKDLVFQNTLGKYLLFLKI